MDSSQRIRIGFKPAVVVRTVIRQAERARARATRIPQIRVPIEEKRSKGKGIGGGQKATSGSGNP